MQISFLYLIRRTYRVGHRPHTNDKTRRKTQATQLDNKKYPNKQRQKPWKSLIEPKYVHGFRQYFFADLKQILTKLCIGRTPD